MMDLTFSVDSISDWQHVSNFVRADQATKCSTLAIYHRETAISIRFTQDAGNLHLSMVKVVPTKDRPSMMRLPDEIAIEAAIHVLGEGFEERDGGALAVVRNFYKTAQI
jgi:hypothetical protein